MDCVNHPTVAATAYCQSCGKALCDGCVRKTAGGQILCEPCWMAWQSYHQPFVAPHPGGPHPALAAFLGLFPGVGAMYNGQFVKGFIHVAIFIVLASLASHYDVFGFLVAAWIIYMSFEAYHTAKALRDGQPLPDPLGLNEAGYWLNPGSRPRPADLSGAAPAQPRPGSASSTLAAALYRPLPVSVLSRTSHSSHPARPAHLLAPPRAYRRPHPHRAGHGVSSRSVRHLQRQIVPLRLAADIDRSRRMADRSPLHGFAFHRFARRSQMNRYIMIRRLRCPAILLLIGVLALLHQTGLVSHFWRLFWPLLFIMIGVIHAGRTRGAGR